jgi:hypothetical protein
MENYVIEIEENDKKLRTKPFQSEMGGIMKVIDKSSLCFGHVLIRTYSGFVSLTNPEITWDVAPDFDVEFLRNVTLKIIIK